MLKKNDVNFKPLRSKKEMCELLQSSLIRLNSIHGLDIKKFEFEVRKTIIFELQIIVITFKPIFLISAKICVLP